MEKKTDGRNWVDFIIRNNLCPPVSFALRFIVWRIIKLLDHQYRGEGVIYKLVFIQSNSYHNVSCSIVAEHDSNENSMSGNLDPMHVPSEFTHVAILMSIVFASMSGFFFARGLKRLTIINRYLNIK